MEQATEYLTGIIVDKIGVNSSHARLSKVINVISSYTVLFLILQLDGMR